MLGANQPRPNAQRERIPKAEFAAKFQSKLELYHFFSVDVGAYCPPKDTVTTLHLRDMANNAKGWIKAAEIKHLSVPFYESLSIEKILGWAKQHHPAIVERYFPIQRELDKFPR
jgi:hypothetical protein